MLGQAALVTLALTLIISGFIVTFIAILLIFVKEVSFKGKTRGGGLIMLGPIPIIFGTDKETMKILMILAIVLMIFAVSLMFLPRLIS